jgi:hypothetical protein
MKSMIEKWCDIIFIIKNKKDFFGGINEKINFHNYIINRHNFDTKPACDLQTHSYMNFHVHKFLTGFFM